ncbi:hypothetical protein D9756_009214 [Leucocoprinus leucothites]|uniref:C2H2-type domain-containing protein n=1 Tax=Leucocoprinus leucothites TaxID=201217 RepID=A0A8H5CY86_9AGAR|nr:hypothetical protein D9756_009214 [Leucoagaricus leucothites]
MECFSSANTAIHNVWCCKPFSAGTQSVPLLSFISSLAPLSPVPLSPRFSTFGTMEYQYTRGIQRPNAAQLSLALSSVLQDSLIPDTRMDIAKEGLYREPPQSSSNLMVPTKTPYSVLSSGSAYSQESWNGPEAWAFNKPPPSSRLASAVLVPGGSYPATLARPAGPASIASGRESTFSTTTGSSRSVASAQSLLQSARASSATSFSNQDSFISLAGVDKVSDDKKEKTKLKQMYKRASMSTKALAKLFSRSPTSSRTSPPGGIVKRSSLKPPMPILSPPRQPLDVDPFASGSSVGSYGLDVNPTPLEHKRTGSSPEVKSPLSIDVQARLQRSPSVSSPLGIPTSPSLARLTHPEYPQSIRGRDVPFPPLKARLPLPLPKQLPPISRKAKFVHLCHGYHQATPSGTSSTGPSSSVPGTASTSAYSTTPYANIKSQPLKGHIRTTSPATKISKCERGCASYACQSGCNRAYTASSATRSPRNPDHYDEKPQVVQGGQASFLDFPPPTTRPSLITRDQDGTGSNSNGSGVKVGSVVVHEVHLVKPVPSMPAMRVAHLESPSKQLENVTRQRPRAGSVRAGTAASDPLNTEKPRKLPIPTSVVPPSDALPSLPQRATRSRARSVSSRDSSPARPLPRPPASEKPSVPQISTQNLTTGDTQETWLVEPSNKSSLRSQPSIRSIPRSPSLPSLGPNFTDAPPLPTSRATSQHEEPRGRSHVRSPSLPTFPVKSTPLPGNVQDRTTRQPLPSGIAERLRSRGRSNSRTRSDDRRPSVDTSLVPPPPLPPSSERKKPTLESIPSASTYGYPESYSHTTGSTLSTASSLQTPPSPTVSRLLKTRNTGRARAASLKSPSMPDLRAALATNPVPSSTSTRSRGPHTPSPPLPQVQTHVNTSTPNMVQQPSVLTSYRTSDASKSSDSLLPYLRPKPNLTRPKELSYPPQKDNVRAFHARSNKEIAKEGDWDFLDRPPRPPRSPSVHIPETPTIAKTNFGRSHFRSQPTRDSDVPPVPSVHVPRERSMERSIGMAL